MSLEMPEGHDLYTIDALYVIYGDGSHLLLALHHRYMTFSSTILGHVAPTPKNY